MLFLLPPLLLPNFKVSNVDVNQLFQFVQLMLKESTYNSQVKKEVELMLSLLQNLLVLKLKLVLKILSFPINTPLPIKLKSVKLKAVVKKKPKTSKSPRELLILQDKSLSQKNIMIHQRVNIALPRRVKVLPNLDQELKFKITSAPKLISQTLHQVHVDVIIPVCASEQLNESVSVCFCETMLTPLIYSS